FTDDRRTRKALDSAREVLDHVVASITPGMPTRRVQETLDVALADAGLAPQLWWAGGYALGIGIRPDWVGHVYLSGETFGEARFDEGYVSTVEILLWDREDGWLAGSNDTIAMTSVGARRLSEFPLGLQFSTEAGARL